MRRSCLFLIILLSTALFGAPAVANTCDCMGLEAHDFTASTEPETSCIELGWTNEGACGPVIHLTVQNNCEETLTLDPEERDTVYCEENVDDCELDVVQPGDTGIIHSPDEVGDTTLTFLLGSNPVDVIFQYQTSTFEAYPCDETDVYPDAGVDSTSPDAGDSPDAGGADAGTSWTDSNPASSGKGDAGCCSTTAGHELPPATLGILVGFVLVRVRWSRRRATG
jgi:hypothetical protein